MLFIHYDIEQSTSFSIGLIFYYWDRYIQMDEIESFDESNNNDHGGHRVRDLFIPKKYNGFKEEISNYKHVSQEQYTQVVITKAERYHDCYHVRTFIADGFNEYDIKKGSIMTIDHLVALILYTDFTDHCTDFSSTFRKQNIFESLERVKQRNREYWWMSKLLREVVEVFGINREGIWNGNGDKEDSKNRIQLEGPFFTGLTKEMYLPQFNIRLCSPTSTSKRMEVAIKFSGDLGMVIQLNNKGNSHFTLGKGFTCAWISRFKEEDERYEFLKRNGAGTNFAFLCIQTVFRRELADKD